MSGKRPFQNNCNTDQQISKKPRPSADFKQPPTRPNNNVNPNWPQPNQNQPKVPPNAVTSKNPNPIALKPAQSIADKDDIFDSDDDEVLFIASQRADEAERRMNQKRQMVSEELNSTYGAFAINAAGSSTQHGAAMNDRNGVTSNGHKQDDKFVFLTTPTPSAAQPSHAPQPSARTEGTGSSQKENLSAQQIQQKRIRALEIQLTNMKTRKSDLEEKLMMKDGETSNLRRDKKALEDQVRALRMQKLQDADMSRDDAEKIQLRKQVANLKAKVNFTNMNTTFSRDNVHTQAPPDVSSLVPHFTNFPTTSLVEPLVSHVQTFYHDETSMKTVAEPLKVRMEREASLNVIQSQLSLAEVNLIIADGKDMDEAHLNSIFEEASETVMRVCRYIQYLAAGHEREVKHNMDPALNAFQFLNIPCSREKLTRIDSVYNFFNEHEGCETIYQAEKMFREEICVKPRRAIACIAALAKRLVKFSEKLLLEPLLNEEDNGRTVVSMLVDTVSLKIAGSDLVHDFFGFTLACSTLMASLGRHYGSYPSGNIIDTVLARFLRTVLECQCDSPLVMLQLSDFLVQVTKDKTKNGLSKLLCRDFPAKFIEKNRRFKYCQYPDEACTFQLFLMYLLTAFGGHEPLNRLELKLLLKITMNLNRVASIIQDMHVDTMRCFLRGEDVESADCCGCVAMLTNALVTLNLLVQRHRDAFQAFPSIEDGLLDESDATTSNKHHAWLGDLARGYITVQSDLFDRISQAYPLSIWFSNYNELFYVWMKNGLTLHNGRMRVLSEAYETENLAEALTSIEIRPTFDTSQKRDEETESSEAERTKVKSLSDQWFTKYSGKSFA